MYTLKVEGAFEAAHRVVNYPGKCDACTATTGRSRQSCAARSSTSSACFVDFKAIKNALKGVLDRFDHRFLNELEPFAAGINPTAENLARIIFEELAGNDAFVRDSELFAITVYETPTSSVTYTRD